MKIAIPTANGKLCPHFGHCEEFTFVLVDEKEKKIISTSKEIPPPHEPGVLPRWLAEKKVNIIIAGGMGQRAQSLFMQNNIKVLVGASIESPKQLVLDFLDGKLQQGDNLCDH
ncbi:MAG TPA: NifB/NifX family molybdenum-iron cluster-binding protein [Victivallales bacterium]|mgnify:FL=1|nr:NifB/NifX family molybdenum-iron cluster-binding protein [Victivallales bacterium]HRR27767.1 NifB/NifX family molybdenum-iron cluster-binding protein [Victivallales bacterium]HRU01538.1 NifB/NifX family molybdenum-iron cluster-binding protein [Victivallales bacterium]